MTQFDMTGKEQAKRNLEAAQRAYDEASKPKPKVIRYGEAETIIPPHPYDEGQLKRIDNRIRELSEGGSSIGMISHAVGISKEYVADKLGVDTNVAKQSRTDRYQTQIGDDAGRAAISSEQTRRTESENVGRTAGPTIVSETTRTE